jgi:hypothetical protein
MRLPPRRSNSCSDHAVRRASCFATRAYCHCHTACQEGHHVSLSEVLSCQATSLMQSAAFCCWTEITQFVAMS